MRRWIAISAGIVFGVVPATFLLLWVVVFLVAAFAGSPEGVEVDVTIVWWRVALFFLTAGGTVVGYVALLLAVKGPTTHRNVIGLLVGVAANLYGIRMAWDLNSYAMSQWSNWYWFASPIVVALAYVLSHFVQSGRNDGAA